MVKKTRKSFFVARYLDFINQIFFKLAEKNNIKEQFIEQIENNDQKVLDIYCKTGVMTIKMAKSRPNSYVIGIEQDDLFLRYAKRRKRKNFVKNMEFRNIYNIDFNDNSFDVVTIFFSLSDLSKEEIMVVFRKVFRVLKNHKKLIIMDYTKAQTKLTQILTTMYYKLINKKHIYDFLELNIDELLKQSGYNNINVKEYNCMKLISSIK